MQKSYINEYLNFISLLNTHKQKIVAVILCDTGIALLAYMDGITNSPSLRGVVLAALRWIYSRFFKREHFSEISNLKRLISIHNIFHSAAGYAVFKVMFRKVMGDPPIGQIAFTFTVIGILNAAVLWPICVGLYFSGAENMPWDPLPWIVLLIASILLLGNIFCNKNSTLVTELI